MSQLFNSRWSANAQNFDHYFGDAVPPFLQSPGKMRKPSLPSDAFGQCQSSAGRDERHTVASSKQELKDRDWSDGTKSWKNRGFFPKMDAWFCTMNKLPFDYTDAADKEKEPLDVDEEDLSPKPPPAPPPKIICARVFMEPPEVRAPPPTPRFRSLTLNRDGYATVFDAAFATAQQRMQESNLNTARKSLENRAKVQKDPFHLDLQRPEKSSKFRVKSLKSNTELTRQRQRPMAQPPDPERISSTRNSKSCLRPLSLPTATTSRVNSNRNLQPRKLVAPISFPFEFAGWRH